MSQSILLIHPDSEVRQDVRSLLASADFRLTEAADLSLFDPGNPDAVLIAWEMLEPAAESLSRIRRQAAAKPMRVIVVAGRESYPFAVRSLYSGADDCIRWPFLGDELLVRINACLRRPQTAPDDERLVAGPIVLDRRFHRVSVHDQNVDLAPTEFRLLAFLIENQGRVFSRNELLMRAWSSNVRAGGRTVDVHVRRLRQQLEPFRCAEMIQTVRGFGYRLRAEESSRKR